MPKLQCSFCDNEIEGKTFVPVPKGALLLNGGSPVGTGTMDGNKIIYMCPECKDPQDFVPTFD